MIKFFVQKNSEQNTEGERNCANQQRIDAGQPYGLIPVKQQRAAGLYEADRNALIKRSESNPIAAELLKHLGERSHELLHVHYSASTSSHNE